MATRDTAASRSPASPDAREIEDVTGARGQPRGGRAAAEITEDVDDLLDEIDSVLEENAEEFVRGYVQKGGQ